MAGQYARTDGKTYVSRARLERRAADHFYTIEQIRSQGISAALEYMTTTYPMVDGRTRRGAAKRLVTACRAWDMSKGCVYVADGQVWGAWIVWRGSSLIRRGDGPRWIGPKYLPLCPVDFDSGRVGK